MFRVILLASLYFCLGCFRALPEPTFQEIAKEVQDIRQLSVQEELTFRQVDAAEFTRFVSEIDDTQNAIQGQVFQLFGHLDPAVDFAKLIRQTVSTSAGAFYHWKRGELIVPESLSKANRVFVFRHEIVHALQDRKFKLGQLFQELAQSDQGDRRLALRFLTEGDAVLVQYWPYHLAGQDPGKMILQKLNSESKQRSWPTIVTGPALVMPYGHAPSAVRYAVQEAGWEAIDRAYQHPGLSTEWILHPEKLVSLNDLPIPVPASNFSQAKKGWQIIKSDTLGEYQLLVLLQEFLPENQARQAAAGWGGDRYQLYEGPGGQMRLVWKVVMDTSLDLVELEEAMEALSDNVTSRFPQGTHKRKLMVENNMLTLIVDNAP